MSGPVLPIEGDLGKWSFSRSLSTWLDTYPSAMRGAVVGVGGVIGSGHLQSKAVSRLTKAWNKMCSVPLLLRAARSVVRDSVRSVSYV